MEGRNGTHVFFGHFRLRWTEAPLHGFLGLAALFACAAGRLRYDLSSGKSKPTVIIVEPDRTRFLTRSGFTQVPIYDISNPAHGGLGLQQHIPF
jgi:hypothetical protein